MREIMIRRRIATGLCYAVAVMAGFSSAAMGQTAQWAGDSHPGTSRAEPQDSDGAPSTLTGDWNGLRTRLHDAGIDPEISYDGEFAANLSGGQRHDATEVGQFTFAAKWDLDKLAGLRGGRIKSTITYRHGPDLGAKAGLGVLQQVQALYGRGQTWRLTELWYQQQLGAGWDLKLGRMALGTDFSSFSCDFQNLTFCGAPVGNIAGDYWYNAPISQWGARLRVKHDSWYAMIGAFENNPHNLEKDFALSHGGATGVLASAELGWTPHIGSAGLPGSYRLGAWYNSSNGDDVLLGVDRRPTAVTGLNPLRHDGRYGVYVLLRQQLTGDYENDPEEGPKATHGLSLFLNVTQADRRTQRTDNQIALGMFYVGPFRGRASDDIGIAVGRTNVNGRAARNEIAAAPNAEKPDAEYAGEIYYSLHLLPWLIVRPNLQYIIDPGGYRHAADVAVLGVKSSITF